MNAPVRVSETTFSTKEVIKAVGSELGELQRKLDQSEQARRDLQDQVDELRHLARTRESDWADDLTELKRVISRMRAEFDELKGPGAR